MNVWQSVIGHQWAVEALQSAIRHERVGHAYLITGPEQIGKSTLARTFAQALNCTAADPAERPCGRCRSCALIVAGRHPDVKTIVGESSARGKATIKIDQIRQLQNELSLTAAEARYKVAILERFDKASRNAANAFLKTLEEPPGDVVLILTATETSTFVPSAIAQRAEGDTAAGSLWDESDIILPTISSRCRTITLRPLPTALIQGALVERWGIEPEKAQILAHLADGRLGRAVQLAQEPTILEERDAGLEMLHDIFRRNRVDRFAMAEKVAQLPEELPGLLQLWLGFWRDLILLCTAGDGTVGVSNIDQRNELVVFAENWPRATVLASLHHTEQALWQIERNANTRLVMENLLLAYPKLD